MTLAISKILAATPASGLAITAVKRWQCYRRARRERDQLLAMDERGLRDLGLSRVDALQVAGQSMWRGCAQQPLQNSL